MSNQTIVVPAAVVSGASSSYTPNKWVTADAGGSGDGSEGDPWTLAQAMTNAVAADQVQIGAGTYNVVSEYEAIGRMKIFRMVKI